MSDIDEYKLIIIIVLGLISVFVTLLVIFLVIKYCHCRRRSSQWSVPGSRDIITNVQDGDIPSEVCMDSTSLTLYEIHEPTADSKDRGSGDENGLGSCQDNSAYEPSDGGEMLMDSELRELMVPDMKENKMISLRSKLLVFISRKIDHTGGQLVLDKMGISLFIPPCAIRPNKPEIIFLVLSWDLKDFPSMTASQTIVSPVVHVGPHGLNLSRPAILSFRHCAFDIGEVQVYASETHFMQDKSWLASDGHKGINKHTILETECQVHISHFTLYTCIAEGEATKKWLQLVAFGGRMRVGRHYEIRVYFLNNTPCALQFAIENEKKYCFKQIKCPQEYLFHGDGRDMLLQVISVNEGWSTKFNDVQEIISFLSIWHGKCPFASFIFKHEKKDIKDINITLSAYQMNDSGNNLTIKLLEKMQKRRRSSSRSQSSKGEQDSHSWTTESRSTSSVGSSPLKSNDFPPGSPTADSYSEGSQSSDSFKPVSLKSQEINSIYVIPHQLKMVLNEIMHPSNTFGNDWRMIASDLGMDSKIALLQEKDNPFLELLKVMEIQKKDLNWLAERLNVHERKDAASVVSHYLQTGEISRLAGPINKRD